MAIEPVRQSPLGEVEGSDQNQNQESQSAETLVRRVPETRLVVLSCDDHVIEVVRNAGQSVAHVVCARDLQHLAQALPDVVPDVLEMIMKYKEEEDAAEA